VVATNLEPQEVEMDGSEQAAPRWMRAGRGDASGEPVDIVELGATKLLPIAESPSTPDALGTDKRRGRFRRHREVASPA
jgi:hypothetical protein